jgi:hypothetical protein
MARASKEPEIVTSPEKVAPANGAYTPDTNPLTLLLKLVISEDE